MLSSTFIAKMYGFAIIIGALMLGTATAMHPVVIDPLDWQIPANHIRHAHRAWMIDHSLMTCALLFWLIGLAEATRRLTPEHRVAPALYISSLSIWLVVLSGELGGFPLAVLQLQGSADPALRILVASLFSTTLIGGYLAMIPAWIGLTMSASGFRRSLGKTKPVFCSIGMLCGIVGVAGTILTPLLPSVWLLLCTNVPPYLWSLWFGIEWLMVQRKMTLR